MWICCLIILSRYLASLNPGAVVKLINIKQKFNDNNVITTKADKGNTSVIIDKRNYIDKCMDFIKNNSITELVDDPTEKFKEEINKTINECT